MKDNTRAMIACWIALFACAIGIYSRIESIAEIKSLKKELATVKKDSKTDILNLLKGRKDIIITVKHYTYNWDYVLCADFKRETDPSDLSCDFELDSSGNKDLMEFKAEKLKQRLIGEQHD